MVIKNKLATAFPIRRFIWPATTVFALLCCAPVFAQEAATEAKGKQSNILADAYDFSTPPTLPKVVAPSEGQIYSAIDRGVRFLIEDQNSNGSWGSPTRTKGLNIYAPVPGAHHAFRRRLPSRAVFGSCQRSQLSP